MGPGFTDLAEFLEEELGYVSQFSDEGEEAFNRISALIDEKRNEYESSGPRKKQKSIRNKFYRTQPEAKERDARYRETEGYRLSQKKYSKTEKGKAARVRSDKKRVAARNQAAKKRREKARAGSPKQTYKLSPEDISFILSSPKGAVELAKMFGVTRDAIYYQRKKKGA